MARASPRSGPRGPNLARIATRGCRVSCQRKGECVADFPAIKVLGELAVDDEPSRADEQLGCGRIATPGSPDNEERVSRPGFRVLGGLPFVR